MMRSRIGFSPHHLSFLTRVSTSGRSSTANLEGTCPVLVEGLSTKPSAEEVDVFQAGVDCEGAQTPEVIRSLERP